MLCPYCAHDGTEVISTVKGFNTERWRKCKKCGKTFCTVEKVKIDKKLIEIVEEMRKDEKKKEDE
jgi:transcriptional repressor NrdR